MQSPESSETVLAATPTAPEGKAAITPDFSVPAVPIGQFTERPDWPRCALGAHVNIHGFEGVVVEIINHSIRVISSERLTQRFNAARLRTLFAPMDPTRSGPMPASKDRPPAEEISAPTTPAAAEAPVAKPMVAPPTPVSRAAMTPTSLPQVQARITHPDFTVPLRAIRTYAGERDFPECAYGKHVDIRGFSGVVVEIEGGVLKVQAADGTLRSFIASNLRKVYGRD
ncbi:MAG TPA: hypothetical protein VMB21_07275 [Candidatus Limnocylindria bacterium]|jgi:hypothetical protein|nr:hypothetical protein [Candidatus Limnocylindria bacterium]